MCVYVFCLLIRCLSACTQLADNRIWRPERTGYHYIDVYMSLLQDNLLFKLDVSLGELQVPPCGCDLNASLLCCHRFIDHGSRVGLFVGQ